jgi:hypothetical protein
MTTLDKILHLNGSNNDVVLSQAGYDEIYRERSKQIRERVTIALEFASEGKLVTLLTDEEYRVWNIAKELISPFLGQDFLAEQSMIIRVEPAGGTVHITDSVTFVLNRNEGVLILDEENELITKTAKALGWTVVDL